jgi:lipid-A-disaccharide synthase-like uncharacterized protein
VKRSLILLFPLHAFSFFAIAMYNKLHFTWASTLVGFIALFFAPVPWLLVFYGERARARSRVAVHLGECSVLWSFGIYLIRRD